MRYVLTDFGDGYGPRQMRLVTVFPLEAGPLNLRVGWVITPWGGAFVELESSGGVEYAVLRESLHAEDARKIASRFVLRVLEKLAEIWGKDSLMRKIDSGEVWVDWGYLAADTELADWLLRHTSKVSNDDAE